VVTGGYMMSNPNVFNGFKNEWGGTPMVAVAVGIPIIHPAGIFAVKAAKAKRREVEYQRQEAEELIALQVNKLQCEHELAYKKMAQAQSNLDMANENLRLADESFKAGVCSSSDLMMAQTAWLQAEGELLDARIDIEMTQLYLKQALGIK
jgi:outer membrane protein TolC